MAPRSSTSSSRIPAQGRRLPTALLLSLVILLIVEVWLRLAPPRTALLYALGPQEYWALQHHVDTFGPADVCMVGSSRAREAFVAPELARLLREGRQEPVRVGNYALSSSYSGETRGIIRQLLRGPRKPKLVVYGVTSVQLVSPRQPFRNTSLLWYLADWRRQFASDGRQVVPYLPRTIRNEIRKRSLTFRWREGIGSALKKTLLGKRPASCPIEGELTLRQYDKPEVVVPQKAELMERTRDERERQDGEERHWMDQRQCRSMIETAQQCQQAGVPLVFLELRTSSLLAGGGPESVKSEFRTFVRDVADRHGARFVAFEDLGIRLDDTQFRDPEHTNLRGALQVTRAFTRKVVLPHLNARRRL